MLYRPVLQSGSLQMQNADILFFNGAMSLFPSEYATTRLEQNRMFESPAVQ